MDLQIKQKGPDVRPAETVELNNALEAFQQKSDPVEFVPKRVVAYDILEFVTDQRLKAKSTASRPDRSLRAKR